MKTYDKHSDNKNNESRTSKNPTSYSNKQKQNIHGNKIKQCTKCNRYHEARKCKAINTKCAKCNKTGHWSGQFNQ